MFQFVVCRNTLDTIRSPKFNSAKISYYCAKQYFLLPLAALHCLHQIKSNVPQHACMSSNITASSQHSLAHTKTALLSKSSKNSHQNFADGTPLPIRSLPALEASSLTVHHHLHHIKSTIRSSQPSMHTWGSTYCI